MRNGNSVGFLGSEETGRFRDVKRCVATGDQTRVSEISLLPHTTAARYHRTASQSFWRVSGSCYSMCLIGRVDWQQVQPSCFLDPWHPVAPDFFSLYCCFTPVKTNTKHGTFLVERTLQDSNRTCVRPVASWIDVSTRVLENQNDLLHNNMEDQFCCWIRSKCHVYVCGKESSETRMYLCPRQFSRVKKVTDVAFVEPVRCTCEMHANKR